MKLCPAKCRCTRPVLTERKAELLVLEHKLEKRIRRTPAWFFWTLAVSNLVTIAVSVAFTLALATQSGT
jgi:hypothetical protein